MENILVIILSICTLASTLATIVVLLLVYGALKDEVKLIKSIVTNLSKKNDKKVVYITDQEEEAFVPIEKGDNNG